MVGGLITLVVVLAVASAAGFAMRHRQGRFGPATEAAAPSGSVLSAADLGAPLPQQRRDQVAADEASSAGHENEVIKIVMHIKSG